MTLYRQDIQYGIPLYEAPDGFYWCTQVYYYDAADSSERDALRDSTNHICGQGLNTNVAIWSVTVREWPSGVLVETMIPPHEGTPLSGPFDPPTLTVFVSLRHEGRQVSYKRVRSPVRHEDYGEDLRLTDWALDYYQANFQQLADLEQYRNCNGVPISEVIVHPYVVSWQLRRGTRRRWERRPLY